MMRRSALRSLVGVLALGGAALLVGVSGGCESSRVDEVRADPTPDLETLYQSQDEIDNALTRTFDEDGRMFWQDLGRVFYVDRPSRLTREPVPVP